MLKKLTWVCAGLLACGGSGVDIDGGTDGAAPNDSSLVDSNTPSDSSLPNDAAPNDSSTGNDASDGGGFQVGNVSGLALWLNAGKDVTATNGKVSSWLDQSGNHNDALQKTANFEPTLVASGIHSLPTLHFVLTTQGGMYGNDMQIADSATLDWGTGDFVLEVVGDYNNALQTSTSANTFDGMGTFYSKQVQSNGLGAGAALYGNAITGNITPTTGFSGWLDQTDHVASQTTGFNTGTPHVFAVQRVGTTLSLRLDGAQTDMQTVGSVDLDPSQNKPGARIGASGDANVYALDGDIAEIIAVQGTITSGDLAGIETYLKTKYGL